jgi:hypothetical protein
MMALITLAGIVFAALVLVALAYFTIYNSW